MDLTSTDLLPPSPAALIIGVTPVRFRQYLKAGLFPDAIRTPLGVLIPRASVVAFAERRRAKIAAARAAGVRVRLAEAN